MRLTKHTRCASIGPLFVLFFGCSSSTEEPLDASVRHCPVGDLSQPAEIRIIHQERNGEFVVTSSGAAVPLSIAPQGGYLMMIGVQARNMDGCTLTLTISLRDQCNNNRPLVIESRPVVVIPGDGDWASPELPHAPNNYSNLGACPSSIAKRDIEGEPYDVTINAEDGDGRRATATQRIVPTCGGDQLEGCLCDCDRDVSLGQECMPDVDPLPPGTCPPPGN